MNELTLTAIRFGLLALLWLFVFAVVGVLRSDLYGAKSGGGRASRAISSSTRERATRTPRAVRKGPTHLAVIDGAMRGTTLPLAEAGTLLGRNPECSLVLSDDFASGRHARLYPEPDGWYLDDLGSTNGTYIGAERVGEHVKVDTGTRIRIGRTVLELRK